MCGVAGIYAWQVSAPPVDAAELVRIRDAMAVRGPDGEGLWMRPDRRVGLAHRRLSIIDLSAAAAQPMSTPDGRLRISFNGEIYNYRELRADLEARGFAFRTGSDTEILLSLYLDRGREMLGMLRGMFAFAIWDERKQGLFLARDPMGIKPLYFSDRDGTLRFASQVKALLKAPLTSRIDPAGHLGFYLFGSVPEPFTLYRDIHPVPAGSSVWVDAHGMREPAYYYDVPAILAEAEAEPIELENGEMRERLRELVYQSTRYHVVADVPVGIFQSSGIDSSVLTGTLSELIARPRTVTLGFDAFRERMEDEVPLAEAVAAHYGTEHRTVWIGKEDFAAEVQNVLEAMDQPSFDGVNTYFVSKVAAESGLKVAVSGLGGDELFAGYSSFREIPWLVAAASPLAFVPRAASLLRRSLSPLFHGGLSPKYAGIPEYGSSIGGAYFLRRGVFMPWELEREWGRDALHEAWAQLQPVRRLNQAVFDLRQNRSRVAALELCWYMRNQLLRDADWAGMAHSLEVRVPYVDAHLFKALAPLIASRHPPSKADLASVPRKALPAAVSGRKKTGFSIPVRDWMGRGEGRHAQERGLRSWARHVISHWPPLSPDSVPPRRTALVFRVGQLGDTLVSLPALAAIRRDNPDDRLVLLTDRYQGSQSFVSSWSVLKNTGWFSDVLYYDPRDLRWSRPRAVGTFVSNVRDVRPDLVYNVAPDRTFVQRTRDWLFFRLTLGVRAVHVPHTEGPRARRRWGAMRERMPEWRRLLSIVPRASSEPVRLDDFLGVDDIAEADEYFETLGVSGASPVLAMGPGSKMRAKVWPEENFVELGRRILAAYPRILLVVVGGAEDRELGKRICEALGERAINGAGRFSVTGSAAVLGRCCGYVGNDTGVMHLAAMMGKPCVALFSARDARGRWDPYGEGHEVLRHEVDCAGCLLEVCAEKRNLCMRLIGVGEVFDAVARMLLRTGAAGPEAITTARREIQIARVGGDRAPT